ncbi:MAG: type II toxin-antitoxin system VapC family toxin [Actinomycetota bacterium]|jgi:toxin-antitoxin system PIN domain toxin|nr:type II toxin-antitoxin system VapC family toxin [Euzebyaceae bacterium]MDQ3451541.1 type II toxin-antitoxin system VapC family toxin [Actinomycetota bacterium]
MRCVDVNVLVYAHRPEASNHTRYRSWLDDARTDDEPLGVSSLVLSGFLRVVTHPRIFRDPSPLDIALEFAETVRAAPSALAVVPGARHWAIFARLCRSAEVKGNLLPDAYLAAMAIERGATWYSADRGFARFSGLRWRHPLEGD